MALTRTKLLFMALLFLLCACDSDVYVNTSTCRDGSSATTCAVEAADDAAEPSHFASGGENPELLRQIQLNVEERIGFARHFSVAYVGCGTGCGSYWFVDRRDGAVTQGPEDPSVDQMIWDLETHPESDVVKVTYGPRDGIPDAGCSAQSFVWNGREFEASSSLGRVACPR
jgi:hypothetical protein